MQDYLVDMSLSVIFALLKTAIKNPAKRLAWRKAMLKLKRAIEIAYEADEEFDAARLSELKAGK